MVSRNRGTKPPKKKKIIVYVEGGGESNFLRSECQAAFNKFFAQLGLKIRFSACGSRQSAYDDFCTAITKGNNIPFLLVDSEAALTTSDDFDSNGLNENPWNHLKNREGDKWDKPSSANDKHVHLMVECMENWFLADRNTLKSFFGQYFDEAKLPAPNRPIESIGKREVLNSLKEATCNREVQKGKYGKGPHSFKILEKMDASTVICASPWAKRFADTLKEVL